MKFRIITAIAVTAFAATIVYGQAKGFAGKWGTDAAVARARGGAAPAPEAGGRGGGQAIMAELKVDASNKVTGQVTEFGNALCGNPDTVLTIDSGTVEGKMITFQVTRPNCPATPGAAAAPGGIGVTWTGTLSDDDQTITAARAIAGGGGGRGGGGGGGGGRGGGAPGGAPAAGGQAPAGGAPAGGAGGGGGRGGGFGGGGGGGAAAGGQAPAGGGAAAGGGQGGAGGRGGGAGGRGGGGQIILHRM